MDKNTNDSLLNRYACLKKLGRVIEWNNSYSPDFNFTSYSSPNFTGLRATLHNFNTNLVIRWTKNLILENNVIYLYNSNLAGANKTTVRWNAAINYNFMKDQRATIKLSAYDILNQNSNIVRLIASQNTLTYNRGNLLPRYFMMTLTYNIKQMPRK
ncbi:outer membrane beta-barrel protein [Flectobacillus roseus]|uniref:outer membrane beta-barrel protein n=1 Tax=Flectobacillus roseus TaxID=502259 RepID=UPI0024B75033|nr:outer membrane beta-barrel protein [Flectobacillus roseus]MDI9871747.1 outer membrane beta-barrel protein [Flectobacillus roseus]